MNFLTISSLNSPFPRSEDIQSTMRGLLLASLIVASILYFFRPFGIEHFGNRLLRVCLVFGMITFITGLAYEIAIFRLTGLNHKEKEWTLMKWILSTSGLVLMIAIGNYIFIAFLVEEMQFEILPFFAMLGYTFLVALIPTAISGLITQNRLLHKNLNLASSLEREYHKKKYKNFDVELTSNERNQTLQFNSEELLFVEAMQNYVSIYLEKENGVERKLVRNSLKNTADQICNEQIIRCHRSYIINAQKISKITGNAQGLIVHLSEELRIPVSRTYVEKIKVLLNTSEELSIPQYSFSSPK